MEASRADGAGFSGIIIVMSTQEVGDAGWKAEPILRNAVGARTPSFDHPKELNRPPVSSSLAGRGCPKGGLRVPGLADRKSSSPPVSFQRCPPGERVGVTSTENVSAPGFGCRTIVKS